MAVTPDVLDDVLGALAEQLESRDAEPIHLVVVGGSGLLAIGAGTRPTEDVDVVALVRGDQLVSADPFPPVLTIAMGRVAADFGLGPDWLNHGPTSLLEEASGLPAGFIERTESRAFGRSLTVSFAGRLDQIRLKLMAFADRGYPRDEADLRQLAPTQPELRCAAEWVREHFMPGPLRGQLDAALVTLGAGDDGLGA